MEVWRVYVQGDPLYTERVGHLFRDHPNIHEPRKVSSNY